jgi:hypothetical protein
LQIKAEDKGKKPRHAPASSMIAVETYWNSSEAKKLFLESQVMTTAAMAIRGQAMKKDFKDSPPFVIYFELGANTERVLDIQSHVYSI